MATQAAPATPASTNEGVPDTPCEPTFFLGGQSYVYDPAELAKAGPELAEMALHETHRAIWDTFAQYHKGLITRAEWRHQMLELELGAFGLRDLIPGNEPLLPNGHLTHTH